MGERSAAATVGGLVCALWLALAGPAAAQAPAFDALRDAYARRDAAAAAAAYEPEAEVRYEYGGAPVETYRGRAEIEAAFAAFFAQFSPDDTVDLNFRRDGGPDDAQTGYYRLRVGDLTTFGRFETTLGPSGLFARDVSRDGTVDDFEGAPGPLLIPTEDEVLDPVWYGRLTGRYRGRDGCLTVITRSVVRLFARNACTGEWRGLTRVSGREWTSGSTLLSTATDARWRFARSHDGEPSPRLEIERDGVVVTVDRAASYRAEAVSVTAPDGVTLSGTLRLPVEDAGPWPATVMLHGSGPQDRDGYASIIAVIADELVANGRAVLAFDKRGSGASGGDGDRAGFDVLAGDAIAAMALLRARPDIDPERVGLGGSSQAGWVAARAVDLGGRPADVLLLGAAGAAMTVAEQNLYNTEVRMRCAGLGDADIDLALRQQGAFFDVLAGQVSAAELDRLTDAMAARPGLADWAFPRSSEIDRSAAAWFVVLDPAYDPLPTWRDYDGRAHFVFAERDDSTPTRLAAERLATMLGVRVVTLPGAQHLGLEAGGLCDELGDRRRFAPGLFDAIAAFARDSD